MQSDRPSGVRKGTIREVRWTQILEAAGEMFNEKGYLSTKLEEIAHMVGLHKGSLYYYIDTKEDLLYELALKVHEEAFQFHLRGDLELAGVDAETRLRAFVDRWLKGVAKVRPWGAYLATVREARYLSPVRRRAVVERRNKLQGLLESIIEDGVKEGHFKPSLHVSILAINISQMLWGTFIWYEEDGPLQLDDIAEMYKDVLLHGVRCPTAVASPHV